MNKPLPLPDHHRSRWLVLPSWRVLHRVARVKWESAEMIAGRGVTVCGAKGQLIMPGFPSRLSLPRCKHCCRAVGIPAGDGIPVNDENLSEADRAK